MTTEPDIPLNGAFKPAPEILDVLDGVIQREEEKGQSSITTTTEPDIPPNGALKSAPKILDVLDGLTQREIHQSVPSSIAMTTEPEIPLNGALKSAPTTLDVQREEDENEKSPHPTPPLIHQSAPSPKTTTTEPKIPLNGALNPVPKILDVLNGLSQREEGKNEKSPHPTPPLIHQSAPSPKTTTPSPVIPLNGALKSAPLILNVLDSLMQRAEEAQKEEATNSPHHPSPPPPPPPLIQLTDPSTLTRLKTYLPLPTPQNLTQVLTEALDIFTYRLRTDNPHFFGFIPCPASPLSTAGELLTSLYNVHAGSTFAGSGASYVEKNLLSWLAGRVGFPQETSGGTFTSGGSMANLTGLAVARDRVLKIEDLGLGVVYVSSQTHFSVMKSLKVLGIGGKGQVKVIGVDAGLRMDVEELRQKIRKDVREGMRPVAIVASCGTTNTGAIDPLDEIADVAREEGVWMHVDGSYGASVVLSNKYRNLARGLERADSIAWDAHKWLFQTYGCGMILVRDGQQLYKTFSSESGQVVGCSHSEASPNPWEYGIELTRPARGMKLWFTMRVLGAEGLGAMIDAGIELAEVAEEELRKCEDCRILSPAQMAILVFRFQHQDLAPAVSDELNLLISRRLVAEFQVGILPTNLGGQVALRMCVLNPELSKDQMRSVISSVKEVAQEVFRIARCCRHC